MAGKSRDHLKVIEEQKQQLQRYEKRLKDVVVAYKSLLKEKEALESSLKALSLNVSRKDPRSCGDEAVIQPETVPGTKSLSEGVSHQVTSSSTHLYQLQEQVKVLTEALSTLTEEKSKMETHFQADKKLLKQERDELANQLKVERQESKMEKASSMEQTKDVRDKLWTQQMERDKEQTNHAVMMRELQTLVAIERSAKEQLESQLDELRLNLDQRTPVAQRCEEYRSKIQILSDELQVVRDRLKATEEKATQPQPLLLRLKKEMEDMKVQHHSSVMREQSRANSAEEQLQHVAQVGEGRVASLEARLSDLSEMVGNYDRIRQQDQQAIQRLKERVTQLDIENSALSRAASSKNHLEELPDNDFGNLNVQAVIKKIVTLKGLLDVANERSRNPTDVQGFLKREGLFCEPEHYTFKEELQQLKEEFERYKLRAQSVLKNRHVRNDDYSKETESFKVQVAELNDKLRAIVRDRDACEKQRSSLLQESRMQLAQVKQQHSQELAKQDAEYKGKMQELENQTKKHRERTMLLLDEKDDEMKLLKASLGMLRPDMGYVAISCRNRQQVESDERDTKEEREDPVVLSEELSTLLMAGRNESHLLHYLQEIARKDKEITELRKVKHQLETAMRDLQTANSAKEQRHQEEVEVLQSEIHRLDRNCSREGANLEYLKNVVYNYMTSSDPGNRHHMLNAIAALLKFSPNELECVKLYNRMWWWQHGAKKPDVSSGLKN